MDNLRPEDTYTRRAALTLVAVAAPAVSQAQPAAHPVVHFEIGCRDRAATSRFFSDLFGWHVQDGPDGTIDTGVRQGIPGHIASLGHEPRHYTMFYVEVDDVQSCLEKVTALGGKTLVPPVNIPTGVFAWFADPEGRSGFSRRTNNAPGRDCVCSARTIFSKPRS